jgi:hypothetical protein
MYPTKLHEALATLKAARAYISGDNAHHFVKGKYGRRGFRNFDYTDSCAEAEQVCSFGALSKVTNISSEKLHSSQDCAKQFLENEMCGSIVAFNDQRPYPAVMEAWDRAIAKCEKAIQEYEAGHDISNKTP